MNYEILSAVIFHGGHFAIINLRQLFQRHAFSFFPINYLFQHFTKHQEKAYYRTYE